MPFSLRAYTQTPYLLEKNDHIVRDGVETLDSSVREGYLYMSETSSCLFWSSIYLPVYSYLPIPLTSFPSYSSPPHSPSHQSTILMWVHELLDERYSSSSVLTHTYTNHQVIREEAHTYTYIHTYLLPSFILTQTLIMSKTYKTS